MKYYKNKRATCFVRADENGTTDAKTNIYVTGIDYSSLTWDQRSEGDGMAGFVELGFTECTKEEWDQACADALAIMTALAVSVEEGRAQYEAIQERRGS